MNYKKSLSIFLILFICIVPSLANSNFTSDNSGILDETVTSLGSNNAKSNIYLTGNITTTATTVDQVVLTKTVAANKTYYLEYVSFDAHFITVSSTATRLGTISLESPSGTKVITIDIINPTTSDHHSSIFTATEPIPIPSGVVVRCVTTPLVTTSILWRCNFGGYEK